MIRARNLSAAHGLHDLSAELERGLVALVGPNGSGKTTLLRILAGLLPHRGDLLIDGRTAYLPQTPEHQDAMRARDVVALGRVPHLGRLGRLSDADATEVGSALARARATHLAARAMGELSGGERARIHLARALATRADILLVDEPFASLDVEVALAMADVLRTESARALVVCALHDLALARHLADRVLVLDGGRVAADGAPELLEGEVVGRVFGIAPPPGGWQIPRLANPGRDG